MQLTRNSIFHVRTKTDDSHKNSPRLVAVLLLHLHVTGKEP